MQRAALEDSEGIDRCGLELERNQISGCMLELFRFPLRASLLSAFNLTVSTIVLSSSYPSAWPSAKQNTRRSLAGRVFANCIVVS